MDLTSASKSKHLWYKNTNGTACSKALQLPEIYFGKPPIIEAELLDDRVRVRCHVFIGV
jgi:hypothetical protein